MDNSPRIINFSTNHSPVCLSKLDQLDHVVAIGGGHGLGRVLSALNHLGERLTGIVTTTDNGGSTGLLRVTEDCIAWGDLRNCINQLITQPSIASSMFEYRFNGDSDLAPHNLGNLMLVALDKMSVRPLDAIKLIREMLDVKSHIIPMSESPTHLVATTQDNQQIFGEIGVDSMSHMPNNLALEPQVKATPEAIEAINKAQLIIIGPGSLLTSIMPPLLMPDLRQAIADSPAKKIFIRNLIAEQSPAGRLSNKELLSWTKRTTCLELPDAILGHHAQHKISKPFYLYDIASQTSVYHDRLKLRAALTDIIETLLTQN
ncbi:MAG: uridine diphosphate-N-acetylglucosamine-binding protein YvcK [Gammaproteobacteria bacterium]|nr:uridine diphosphate-N-acetylglucosamine-binding protein YvcK [Gammaproteobacteria bacterium]